MHSGFYWGKRQAGAEALVAWIDSEQQRSPNQRWGIWGGVIGGLGGVAGALTGIMGAVAGIGPNHPGFYVPLSVWAVGAVAATAVVISKNRKDDVAWGREGRNQMTRLLVARWHGDLRSLLGDEGLRTMNEAASLVLQCRTALNGPAWRAAAGGTVWSDVREKALRGLDSAMARLVIVVTSSGTTSESEEILRDLKDMADEIAKAATRHAMATGQPAGGTESLREALREMKEVSAADEEYMEQRFTSLD